MSLSSASSCASRSRRDNGFFARKSAREDGEKKLREGEKAGGFGTGWEREAEPACCTDEDAFGRTRTWFLAEVEDERKRAEDRGECDGSVTEEEKKKLVIVLVLASNLHQPDRGLLQLLRWIVVVILSNS